MYSASASFLTAIKSNLRQLSWSGVINTPTPISFSDDDIVSGSLTRAIAGESLEIGSVYASQLTMELILPSVSRYELYGCEITLSVSVAGAADVIPMGVFTITEANQTASHINITAYDAMIDFDSVHFPSSAPTDIQTPYYWLKDICTACGVTLGSTEANIRAFPNGARRTGLADTVSDIGTWRDILGYIAAYLCGFAYIGRDGKLYIGAYTSGSDDTVPASFRFSSGLSDFRTTYDGLYATFKQEGVQEYVSNTNTGGIVLDLGVNPFLQFTNSTNRLNALQEIIDAWDGIYYVPYEAEMPLIPIYDPGDVLTFTGNQADVYDYGAITEITYNIGGTMSVICGGDNPKLTEAQDRFSKSVEGLSKDYSNGQQIGGKDFWILHTTNTSSLTVGSTETEICEIEFEQTVFGQRLEMILTVDAVLSASAEVRIRVIVDDNAEYEMDVTEDKAFSGERVFHCSNPQRIYGEGTHVAKVYMTVTDDPIKVGDLF